MPRLYLNFMCGWGDRVKPYPPVICNIKFRAYNPRTEISFYYPCWLYAERGICFNIEDRFTQTRYYFPVLKLCWVVKCWFFFLTWIIKPNTVSLPIKLFFSWKEWVKVNSSIDLWGIRLPLSPTMPPTLQQSSIKLKLSITYV